MQIERVHVRVVHNLRYVLRCAIEDSFNFPLGLIKYIVTVIVTPSLDDCLFNRHLTGAELTEIRHYIVSVTSVQPVSSKIALTNPMWMIGLKALNN